MKSILLGAALLLISISTFAQRAKSPADAAVFIRIVGRVHAEIEEFGVKRSVDLDRVEISTGSGFVISPYGYVITNDHVVNDIEPIRITRIKGFQEAKITLKTSSIDVCFQAEVAAVHGLASACSAASVVASDPVRDLAVLFINGSNLPYIALGDSDAVATGLQVDALGYPLGRDVDVGKAASVTTVAPDVSMTRGTVSALRANDAGERRYLQITNSVNPGNSGGPLVNGDGFAVGVIRMRLRRATDIAFAIPINDVKDFLESHGLDQSMPARRLRLGLQSLEAKGVRLRLPETLADGSPFYSHVEAVAGGLDIVLRIDRVLSPWTLRQLEETLIGGQTLEPLLMTPREGRLLPRAGEPTMLSAAQPPASTLAKISEWITPSWTSVRKRSSPATLGRPSGWRSTKACSESRCPVWMRSGSCRVNALPSRSWSGRPRMVAAWYPFPPVGASSLEDRRRVPAFRRRPASLRLFQATISRSWSALLSGRAARSLQTPRPRPVRHAVDRWRVRLTPHVVRGSAPRTSWKAPSSVGRSSRLFSWKY
jgi:S1-C subfamily serine protease